MTNTSGPTTPAGWYPDPAGSGNLRWWDGATWTAHLAPRPTPVATPVVQAPAPQPVVAPGMRTVTGEPYVPFQGSWNQSYQGNAYGGAELTGPGQWNTASAWVLAFSPLYTTIALALIVILTVAGADLSKATSATFVAILGIAIVLVLVDILLAISDRRKLRSSGFLQTASVWWILLGPVVYLIVRAVNIWREVRHGIAPMITYIVVAVVSGVLIGILAALSVIASQGELGTSAYAVQFTAGVEKGLNENGGHYVVVCPTTFPTTINAQFTCTATDTATNTAHTLNIEIVQGADGKPTEKLLSVNPPITQ
jgi:hypothetical protein